MFNAGLGVELVSSAHSKYNKAVKAHLNDWSILALNWFM